MDNSEISSEQGSSDNQANQAPVTNRISVRLAQRKTRAIAATPNTTRASRRRRSCSWASRQRWFWFTWLQQCVVFGLYLAAI